MILRLALILALISNATAAELQEESDIKFAIYSSAWGENALDRLRLLAHNTTDESIRLDTITFLKDDQPGADVELELELSVPAQGYAELTFDYVDLLADNECIERTLAENWRLAEISNYTLNPSVRNLIIEDTDSFRIYQCVETVHTRWTRMATSEIVDYEEWVLFHFESRSGF